MSPKEIAEAIRHARASSGLTVSAAAERNGIKARTLAAWESGAGLGIERVADLLTLLEDYGYELTLRRIRGGRRLLPGPRGARFDLVPPCQISAATIVEHFPTSKKNGDQDDRMAK